MIQIQISWLSKLMPLLSFYILKLQFAQSRGNSSLRSLERRIDFANIYSGFTKIFRNETSIKQLGWQILCQISNALFKSNSNRIVNNSPKGICGLIKHGCKRRLLKGNITNWYDIVFLLKLCILQEERLTVWKWNKVRRSSNSLPWQRDINDTPIRIFSTFQIQ